MSLNSRTIEILSVAIVYVLLAKVGQIFAIAPGNITPLWFPSGVMVAWTLLRGSYIWPGIFLGALIGNIWAYLSLESISTVLFSFFAASMNGLGDVIACVVLIELLCKSTSTRYPFKKISQILYFLALAVVLGATVSAFIGVGGLFLFGFVDGQQFFSSFAVWLFGDALGVLIFTPMVAVWCQKDSYRYPVNPLMLLMLVSYFILLSSVFFELIHLPRYFIITLLLLTPVVLYGILLYGQRVAYSLLLVVGAIAIMSTVQGKGVFANGSLSSSIIQLQFFIGLFSLNIYVLGIYLHRTEESANKLAEQKEELETLYRRDQLTQIWNRYRIEEFLNFEISRFFRHNTHFGLILFDIDDFKKVNDQFGHLEGDKVLVELTNLINSHIRQIDLFGRWGGEEFIIIVTDTDEKELENFAFKICHLISEHEFSLSEQVTVSIGASMVKENDTVLTILDRVDEALYISKREGKNQLTII